MVSAKNQGHRSISFGAVQSAERSVTKIVRTKGKDFFFLESRVQKTTSSQSSRRQSHCSGTPKCLLCALKLKSKKSDPATTFFVGAVAVCFSTI